LRPFTSVTVPSWPKASATAGMFSSATICMDSAALFVHAGCTALAGLFPARENLDTSPCVLPAQAGTR
jgi:hypothetical protein